VHLVQIYNIYNTISDPTAETLTFCSYARYKKIVSFGFMHVFRCLYR